MGWGWKEGVGHEHLEAKEGREILLDSISACKGNVAHGNQTEQLEYTVIIFCKSRKERRWRETNSSLHGTSLYEELDGAMEE